MKVTPSSYLIGLSNQEADKERNLQLLEERGWFDIPVIYNNNRRAILAMEKRATRRAYVRPCVRDLETVRSCYAGAVIPSDRQSPAKSVNRLQTTKRALAPRAAGGMRRPLSPTADIPSRTSVAAKCHNSITSQRLLVPIRPARQNADSTRLTRIAADQVAELLEA